MPGDPHRALSLQTLKKDQNPTWNEEFEFVVRNPASDKLTLQVYDWDRTSANQKVGHPTPVCVEYV